MMLATDKEIDVGSVAKFSFSIEMFLASLCIRIWQGHTKSPLFSVVMRSRMASIAKEIPI